MKLVSPQNQAFVNDGSNNGQWDITFNGLNPNGGNLFIVGIVIGRRVGNEAYLIVPFSLGSSSGEYRFFAQTPPFSTINYLSNEWIQSLPDHTSLPDDGISFAHLLAGVELKIPYQSAQQTFRIGQGYVTNLQYSETPRIYNGYQNFIRVSLEFYASDSNDNIINSSYVSLASVMYDTPNGAIPQPYYWNTDQYNYQPPLPLDITPNVLNLTRGGSARTLLRIGNDGTTTQTKNITITSEQGLQLRAIPR